VVVSAAPPANLPRPATRKRGHEEKSRGEVFAAQGVALTAGVGVCDMQAMTQVHCQGSQSGRTDHTCRSALEVSLVPWRGWKALWAPSHRSTPPLQSPRSPPLDH